MRRGLLFITIILLLVFISGCSTQSTEEVPILEGYPSVTIQDTYLIKGERFGMRLVSVDGPKITYLYDGDKEISFSFYEKDSIYDPDLECSGFDVDIISYDRDFVNRFTCADVGKGDLTIDLKQFKHIHQEFLDELLTKSELNYLSEDFRYRGFNSDPCSMFSTDVTLFECSGDFEKFDHFIKDWFAKVSFYPYNGGYWGIFSYDGNDIFNEKLMFYKECNNKRYVVILIPSDILKREGDLEREITSMMRGVVC